MKISHKLTLGFTFIFVVLVAMSSLLFWFLRQAEWQRQRIGFSFSQLAFLKDLNQDIHLQLKKTSDYMLLGKDQTPDELKDYEKKIIHTFDGWESLIQQQVLLGSEAAQGNRTLVNILRQQYHEMTEDIEETVRLQREGRHEEAVQRLDRIFTADFDKRFANIVNVAMDYMTSEVKRVNEMAKKQTGMIASLSAIMITLAFLSVLYLSLAITRSIAVPINQLKNAMAEIGRGKLEIPIHIQANDEIGDLAESFQRMAGDIKKFRGELEQQVVELTALNEELEAFSYSVSHDLRAPLNNIEAFSKALQEDYADKLDATGKDYLDRLSEVSYNMEKLIDDMLTLSRLTQSGINRQAVNLSDIANEIAADLKNAHPERQVDFVIASGLVLNADAQLFHVVLENLLGNAWKFSSKHPRAKIEVGTSGKDGSKIIYFVRDDGAGFDMKYAKKLFGVFQRLHRNADFAGTGIGLASVRRIIHRHGGRVWAEGAPEQGATIYFAL